jgi:dipeptide/tripeptide permease
MEELDRRITEALRADEAEQYARLDPELPPWEMVFNTFKGRNRWLNILISFWMLVFFGLAVWCVVQFFRAEEVRPSLTWGLGFLFFMTGSAFLKVWWWMEMQKNSIIREVKRVELQVASLASRAPA